MNTHIRENTTNYKSSNNKSQNIELIVQTSLKKSMTRCTKQVQKHMSEKKAHIKMKETTFNKV